MVFSWSKYLNGRTWKQNIPMKWWNPPARTQSITTDDLSLGIIRQLTQLNFGYTVARRDLKSIYTSLPRVTHTVTV
jgi:hypothetical protein